MNEELERARAKSRELLTPRQREIANLVAEGFTNQAIQERLAIEDPTMQKHLHDIYERLRFPQDPSLHRRALLVRYVLKGGPL